MTKPDPVPSGEERERSYRRAYWGYNIGGLVIATLGVGLFTLAFESETLEPALRQLLIILANGAMLIGLGIICVLFWRRMDELERLDNLWAMAAGFVGTGTSNLILATLLAVDLRSEPDGNWLFIILGTGVVCAFLTYGWRKIANR